MIRQLSQGSDSKTEAEWKSSLNCCQGDAKSLANQGGNWHATSEYEVELAAPAVGWEASWKPNMENHRP